MNKSQQRFSARYPHLGGGPLPVEPYVSAAHYEAEREGVFRRSWLCMGRQDELPAPGSWLTREVAVLGASVLLVRGADGEIRAFHNACRHRLNRVAIGECGSAERFVCGFHGWVYGLDGRVLSIPDEGAFEGLDRSRLGLRALAVGIWQGFVFVHFEDPPPLSLREFIGELWSLYDGYPMERMTRISTIRGALACNWKVVLDAFQEAYHVLELHKRSAPHAFSGPDNPLAHLNDVRLFERHRVISVYGNPRQQPTGAAALALKLAHTGTYTPALGEARVELPAGINPERRPDWAFDETVVYPNMSWYTAEGWALVQYYWPLDVSHTAYEQHFYSYPPATAAQLIGLEHTKAMLFDVALEDLSTVEQIQEVAASGAVGEMYLSDQEIAVRHAHAVVQRALESVAS